MTQSYHELIDHQHLFFDEGQTKQISFRLQMLEKLRQAIRQYEKPLLNAVYKDFRKSPTEAYMTEIGILLDEIRFHIRHLKQWTKKQHVSSPLSLLPSRSAMSPEPYGTVLIIAPWNYPIQLALMPLIGAISAGNCAIIKPSEYAPHTAKILSKMLENTFSSDYIAVVEGNAADTEELLKHRFDYIFFTGSPAIGKIVMQAAAKHLTPVTLELGGKSPVIIDKTANLKAAARKIAFGKVLNAGQICVAPDYLLIDESMLQDFLLYYRMALKRFSPDGSFSQMPQIINERHFHRLCNLLGGENIAIGGKTDSANRVIEPTVLTDITLSSPIMQEEIFGPILPILTYRKKIECIPLIKKFEKPLALYLFSNDKSFIRTVFSACSFGGGCVNDVIMQTASNRLPFGGVGNAGIGAYHGKASFDTFTHYRGIVYSGNHLENPLRYPPFSDCKDKIIRMFLK